MALYPRQKEEFEQPLVSFVIMPIFALGNSGISFIDMDLSVLVENHVAIGVLLGLPIGKPPDILAAVWLTEKVGLGRRSRAMTWRRLTGLGFLAANAMWRQRSGGVASGIPCRLSFQKDVFRRAKGHQTACKKAPDALWKGASGQSAR